MWLTVLACGCGRLGFRPGEADADARDSADAADASAAGALVSRGVLVRYFLDDAASGQGAPFVRDDVDGGFDLPLTYDTPTNPQWTTTATGRGLAFDTVGLDGGACRALGGKLLALDGLQAATLEVRARASACSTSGSRFVHVGEGDGWAFSLACLDTQSVVFAFDQSTSADTIWNVDVTVPVTLTLVFDSAQPDPNDRRRLYANGVRKPIAITTQIPALNQPLVVSTTMHLCIGNRFTGARTPIGAVTYGALYTVALTDTEIAANAARLAMSDDP